MTPLESTRVVERLMGIVNTQAATIRELREALETLPLAAFDKDMNTIDAAEFVDASADFMEAMEKARAALAKSAEEKLSNEQT